MLGIYVCLAECFIWATTLGAGYEKSGDDTLHAALLFEYIRNTLLPSLVLEEPCFHCVGGLF